MESVLEILSYVFWVVLAITILVFVHEMGHFLFAKLFKMRVDRFSVGFPPNIVKKTIGDTEYVIGATPLGGYVKIAGMVDESLDTEFAEAEPQPWEFRSKPVWQRMIVISAGVVFNVILAFVIFTGLKYSYGETHIPADNIDEVFVQEGSLARKIGLRTGDKIIAVSGREIQDFREFDSVESLLADPLTITVRREGELLTVQGPEDIFTQLNRSGGTLGIDFRPSMVGAVASSAPAERIGLMPGDRIVSIGGTPVRFWEQMAGVLQESKGEPVLIRWERADSLIGDEANLFATVVDRRADVSVLETTVAPVEEGGRYILGVERPTFEMLAQEYGIVQRSYDIPQAIGVGAADTWMNTRAIVISLTRVFTGQENFKENVGGPIMIAQVTKQAAEAGARFFWHIVAVLSITLAIINILPIPVLDGGHLAFLAYEGITRREPSLRLRMVMQQVGMILLLAFMTFLIFNDILRL